MFAGPAMRRYTHLIYERRGDVAYVGIDLHDLLDATDMLLRMEMCLAFTTLRDDEKVRAVVLTSMGDGSFFRPGLRRPIEPLALSASGTKGPMRTLLGLIKTLGKPVVLAIDGMSPDCGCEIAMVCACRIATDTAGFDLSGMEAWPIRHETLSAYEAYGVGLVDEIVPPMELLERTDAVACEIAANPSTAARYANEAARRCLEMGFAKRGPTHLDAERRTPQFASR